MYSVFKDPSLQKKFDLKGYILVSSLLSKTDIDSLTELFLKFRSEYSGSFHTSHFSTDTLYKKTVNDTISSIVFPKAEPYLNNYQSLFGNFMIKNPDPTFSLDMHADWTYVDEEKFQSIAIWVPLIDVDADNGCLGIIEGSHKVTNNIRGPLIRQSSREQEGDWEKRYGKLLPMKAGDAIIYSHALLHYSHSNKTDRIRPAINLSLAPVEAPIIHYCFPEGATEIELYNVPDTEFYIRYDHFQRPQTNTLFKTLPADSVPYMDKRMKSFWKKRVFDQIKEIFL